MNVVWMLSFHHERKTKKTIETKKTKETKDTTERHKTKETNETYNKKETKEKKRFFFLPKKLFYFPKNVSPRKPCLQKKSFHQKICTFKLNVFTKRLKARFHQTCFNKKNV